MVKRKEKIILTDVDGCIIDWEFGFHMWMETHGHMTVEEKSWNADKKYGLPEGTGAAMIRIFNESASMGFLPPLRDAQYYVKLLHEKHTYRFVAVTSFSDNEHAIKLREKNLSKIFGPNTFKEVICLPCGAPKDEVFSDLSKKYSGHILVEDLIKNAEVAADCGFESILMMHGYNFDYDARDDIRKVTDWEEIYNLVTRK